MMESNSKRKTALAVGLTVMVLAVAVQFYVLITGNKVFTASSLYVVASIVNIVALSFAAFYISTEFTKSSSSFYKFFIYLFLASILVRIIDIVLTSAAAMTLIPAVLLSTIAFGFLTVLAVASDLGKKKSLFLAYAILVCTIAALFACFLFQDLPTLAVKTSIFCSTGPIIMAAVLVSSVHMKYYDKALRHTK